MITVPSGSLEYQLSRASSKDISVEELVSLTHSTYLDVLECLAVREGLPDEAVLEAVNVWKRFAFPAFGKLMRNETLSDKGYDILVDGSPRNRISGSLLLNRKITGFQWLKLVSRMKKSNLSQRILSCNAGKVKPEDIEQYQVFLKEQGYLLLKFYDTAKALSSIHGVPDDVMISVLKVLERLGRLNKFAYDLFNNHSLNRLTAEWLFNHQLSHQGTPHSKKNIMITLLLSGHISPEILFSSESTCSIMVSGAIKEVLSYEVKSAKRFKDVLYSYISEDESVSDVPEEWKDRVILSFFRE